jgi:hypothetical protein
MSGVTLPPEADHRDRVRMERRARYAELTKLREFIFSHKFSLVPEPEATLLITQASIMAALVEVLDARIRSWEPLDSPQKDQP